MPTQIVLAWEVDVSNSSFGPAEAATALGAVPLYKNFTADPVLGALFGLTVDSDVTTSGLSTATRTITFNMAGGGAPPPFPCHPITSVPPIPPYLLLEPVTLPGSFFPSNGSTTVLTSVNQTPSIVAPGTIIQFLSQTGTFYVVLVVGPTSITLAAPYTGKSGNTGAFKNVFAPATRPALYSSSVLDTAGVATVPAIQAGSGAQTVEVQYLDSTGSPFTTSVVLTGKRPVALPLAVGSIDIAEITEMIVTSVGGFGNSIGQITLVNLSEPLPPIPANATPFDFFRLTDQAQLLIDRALVYLPPSYFTLAQQGSSAPQLAGDFFITTGSASVRTSIDQTGVLAAGNVIRFSEQQYQEDRQLSVDVLYTITSVTPKIVLLDRPYTGIDSNNTGGNNIGTNSDAGTKGNIGAAVSQKATAATLVFPSPAASPTNDQLSAPLGQFVALETASPPPNAPLDPETVSDPTFLSGIFTRALQLALAVPVTPQPIAFI